MLIYGQCNIRHSTFNSKISLKDLVLTIQQQRVREVKDVLNVVNLK